MHATGKRPSLGVMKRLSVVAVCLLVLALFLARGSEEEAPPISAAEPGGPDVRIPLPPLPDPEPPAVRARGAYQLARPGLQVTLELMRGRAFRFRSTRGGDVREATGTWSLTGTRLTLAYRAVDGEPIGKEPTVVANEWRGTTILLKDTGLPGPIVLKKRTMIRGR